MIYQNTILVNSWIDRLSSILKSELCRLHAEKKLIGLKYFTPLNIAMNGEKPPVRGV